MRLFLCLKGSAKIEKKDKIAIRENKRDKIFLWNRIYSGTCTFSSTFHHSYSIRLLERKISIAIVRTFAYNKDRWKYYSRKEMFYMATKSVNLYARIEITICMARNVHTIFTK